MAWTVSNKVIHSPTDALYISLLNH